MKLSREVRHGKAWREKMRMLPAQPPPVCVCGEPLTFGTYPLSGTSFQWCPRCGEQPVPRAGVRRYDQGLMLRRELAERVDSARREPKETTSYQQPGRCWRQRTNEYLTGRGT